MIGLRTDDKLYFHKPLNSSRNYPSKKGLRLGGNWVNPICLLKSCHKVFLCQGKAPCLSLSKSFFFCDTLLFKIDQVQ